jgi:hypothetical protein
MEGQSSADFRSCGVINSKKKVILMSFEIHHNTHNIDPELINEYSAVTSYVHLNYASLK